MMDAYSGTKYIYLHPGDFYFGDCHTRMRTLLGSCVSIMAWHPELKIGGMCHYVLPSRCGAGHVRPDGRYAEEAVTLLLNAIAAADTRPSQYRVRLAGGGSMFRSTCP
ncbi:MAG: chemotaxis protein CheD, partial [Sulfuricella sp.]